MASPFETLTFIIEATHQIRKNRGGYVEASQLVTISQEALQALSGLSVALLGGFAVSHYGEPRATKDFDLTLSAQDLKTAAKKLKEAGFVEKPVNDFKGVDIYPFEKEGIQIDLLAFQNPTFQKSMLIRAVEKVDLFGYSLQIISVEDLIVTKLLSFRDKDKMDINSIHEKVPEVDTLYIRDWAQKLKIFDRLALFPWI